MDGYTIFQRVLGVCGKINKEMAILILKVGESMSLARGSGERKEWSEGCRKRGIVKVRV